MGIDISADFGLWKGFELVKTCTVETKTPTVLHTHPCQS